MELLLSLVVQTLLKCGDFEVISTYEVEELEFEEFRTLNTILLNLTLKSFP
jgi:hypothetical protein